MKKLSQRSRKPIEVAYGKSTLLRIRVPKNAVVIQVGFDSDNLQARRILSEVELALIGCRPKAKVPQFVVETLSAVYKYLKSQIERKYTQLR